MSVYTHLALSEREYPEKKLKEGKSLPLHHQVAARLPSVVKSNATGARKRIGIITGTPITVTNIGESVVAARII